MVNDPDPTARDSAQSRPPRAAMRAAVAIGIALWLGGVAYGLQKLWVYKSTPGANAEAPAQWPGQSRVTPLSGRSTLVMFIHPLCSCTRASLEELDSILQQSGDRLTAWVLILHPEGTPKEWENSSTWNAVRDLRGVHVIDDRDGAEAARFGAATSGQVVLYDSAGRLQFAGGITGARGHVGANTGEARVISLVKTGEADSHEHEVFGCGLHDPNPRTDVSPGESP